MTKRVSETVWKERIEACKRSGEKVEKWCAENQISRPSYYYWHSRIKNLEINDQSSNPIFMEIPNELDLAKKDRSSPEISIAWKDFTIKIRDEETIPMLAKLINRLGDEPC
jgi:hypothetical protein